METKIITNFPTDRGAFVDMRTVTPHCPSLLVIPPRLKM